MAPPTPDEIFEFIDGVVKERAREDAYPIFEWEYLLTLTFRHFRSTSNACRSRLETLLEEGRLARVDIRSSGHVYLDDEAPELRMFSMFFQYENPSRSSYYDNWGYITFRRLQEHSNVWRDGKRYLFTTAQGMQTLRAAALAAARDRQLADQAGREKERAAADAALNSIAPDATDLLRRLRDTVKEIDSSSRLRTGVDRNDDLLSMQLYLYDAAPIGSFLDILRRGLPDVPRETSTDQGEPQ